MDLINLIVSYAIMLINVATTITAMQIIPAPPKKEAR